MLSPTFGSTATKPGAVAQTTTPNKIDKYSKLASTHIFYPFATETAGTWHHEMAIELTHEIGRRITTITKGIRDTTFFPTPFHGSVNRKCGFFSQHHGNGFTGNSFIIAALLSKRTCPSRSQDGVLWFCELRTSFDRLCVEVGAGV